MKATGSRKLVVILLLMAAMSPLFVAILDGSHNQDGLTTDHTMVLRQSQASGLPHAGHPTPQTGTSKGIFAGTIFTCSRTDCVTERNSFKAGPIAYRSSGTVDPLTNGVTVAGFLNGTGDWQMWYINVSSGARCMRSVLTGQSYNYYSLYGKLGSYPTTSSYDWGQTWSNSLDKTYYSPQAGQWYIMVYSASDKGNYLLTITVLYTGTVRPLTAGVPVTGRLNATAASDLWYIDVSSGATSMRSVLTCPSNCDFDLYGKYGSYPDLVNYYWAAWAAGNEDINISSPSAGRWYIMPYSYFGNGTYQLSVTITYVFVVHALSSGVTATGGLNGSGAYDLWYIFVSSGATLMRSVLTCPTGADFNLYGKAGSYATASDYDWRGITNGSDDVSYTYPISSYWYIMVNSLSGSGTYQLTVTITYPPNPQYLSNGYSVLGILSGPGSYDLWYIYVSSGATLMRSILTCPQSANFDLYGERASIPTTYDYYWSGTTGGSEDVSYTSPGEGYWYIMVRSASGSGTYYLTVTISYGSSGPPDVSGTIFPIAAVFMVILIFLVIVASSKRDTMGSGSRSDYRPSQGPPDEAGTEERRAQIAAPRLVQCKRCGASMKQGDNNCWNCGAPAKAGLMASPAPSPQTRERIRSGICMVCKRGLEKADEILFCPYCGGLAHKDHMLEWLHVKDYCPTCGRHLDETEVKKQTDPQPKRSQQRNLKNRTG